MSLETISANSLSNKTIQQIGNAQISLPANFNSSLNYNQSLSLRVCLFLFLSLSILNNSLFVSIVNNATISNIR